VDLTLLGSEVGVPGLTHAPNVPIRLRGEVAGSNPTTIRLKAWPDGQAEPPAWQYTTTDSEPALQGPGSVGVRTYVSAGNTAVPVVFSFDDVMVLDLAAGGPLPTPTPTSTLTPTSTATPIPPTPTRTPTPTASVPTATPTPTSTPVGGFTTYAQDTYDRTVAGGWASAPIGGAYTLFGTASDFQVGSGVGSMRSSAAGQTRAATLLTPRARDVNASAIITADKPAVGGNQYVYLVLRRVNDSTYYQARVRFDTSARAWLQFAQTSGGNSTLLGSEALVPGFVQGANTPLAVRARVMGAGPTTLQFRAWPASQMEPPTWLYSFTDSTPALQTTGALGLMTIVSSLATNAPIVFTFDDFRVTNGP
jgi:hypothetical protein